MNNDNPLKFGTAGLFGSMGGNQMINSLTNANAMAAAQQAAQQARNTMGGGGMNDYSQPIMTGSLDPMTQQIGLGMFGGAGARQRAIAGSGLMMNSPMRKSLGSEPNVDPCSAEFDYEIASDAGHSSEDIKKYRAANCGKKSGGDPDEEKAKRDESMSRGAQGEIN
ncbi:MAG: hypothetical protein GY951_04685 [Psychromonas sp.]|nr:hypothetical protein [Psychromonas sp.]